jgi:hypothetical protein
MSNKKRGRPVTHPRIQHIESGKIFSTYKEAGESVGGSRYGVKRCCEGTYRHHKNNHFKWVNK